MRPSKVFKINDLVDLRLIKNETYIYVKNRRFMICASLVLDIPKERIEETDEIRSIDKAKEIFKPRNSKYSISPEEEFEGHCSNIQAFFEYGLNTDLLESRIAFPLLKELVDLGYEPAKRVFKEEIVRRYNEGTENSRKFLYDEGFLRYLNKEEVQTLIIPNPLDPLEKELMKYSPEERRELLQKENLKAEKFLKFLREELERRRIQRKEISEKLREERKERRKQNAIFGEQIDREWLIKEFGENCRLFESLQEKLKRQKEKELKKLERRKFDEYESKLKELNYLNSHPWSHVDPPRILARIAEWIAAKIALNKKNLRRKSYRKHVKKHIIE